MLLLAQSPYVTHFDDDTPLYPGITAKWQALAEDTQAQQQLQRLPQRLRRLLVEEGQVQMCTPLTAAGQGTPAPVPLQLVALRAAHLAAGTNLVLDEGQWAQVRVCLGGGDAGVAACTLVSCVWLCVPVWLTCCRVLARRC
jgi:hypothetical protein